MSSDEHWTRMSPYMQEYHRRDVMDCKDGWIEFFCWVLWRISVRRRKRIARTMPGGALYLSAHHAPGLLRYRRPRIWKALAWLRLTGND